MGDYSPVNSSDATPYTRTAGATIVGGTLVSASADETVITCVTGTRPVGVAAQDAVTGARFTVWPLPGIIHEVTVEGVLAVVAGNTIIPGATGFIKAGAGLAADAAAGTLIGMATRGGTGGTGTGKARFIGT
jgi:hypothetical protein